MLSVQSCEYYFFYVIHLVGSGDLPKGDVIPQAYLVKWVTRGREGWVTSFIEDPSPIKMLGDNKNS